MADTSDPGNWASVVTLMGAIIAGIAAGIAGIRRGEQRAARGFADGDHAALSGGALLLDGHAMSPVVKELRGIRLAVEKVAKQRESAEDRDEMRRRDAMDARLDAIWEEIKKKE